MNDRESAWRPLAGFPGYHGTRDGRCRSWRPSGRFGDESAEPRELAGRTKVVRRRVGGSVKSYRYRVFRIRHRDGAYRDVTAGRVSRLAFGGEGPKS